MPRPRRRARTTATAARRRGAPVRLAALIAAAGLAGCGASTGTATAPATAPQAQATTAAPAAVADAPAQTFLAALYGPAASLHGEWRNDRGDVLRVCADGRIAVDDRAQRLLAVCTTLKNADFDNNGRIDLFALASQDGRTAAAAEARALPFWFNGAPAQVKIVRIGRARYAFDIQAHALDDNGRVQQRTWYVAQDGRFAKALSLPVRYTSDGTAWCRYAETTTCEGATTDLAYDLRIDARDPQAEVYPLTVDTHGIRCDSPLAATTTPVDFDAGARAYRVPATLHIPTSDCGPGGARSRSSHQD